MDAIAVIPARLSSTRLPRKVLADVCGKPMLWYVWQRACQARQVSQVWVATDSAEVFDRVDSWGGRALMTSPDCASGTERIVSILDSLEGELILNVQGDEPLVDPDMLDALVQTCQGMGCQMATPVYALSSIEELLNPNIVKVARAYDGRAIYFSRSPVPYVRDLPQPRWLEQFPFWGHVGVYAYRREVLEAYPNLKPSALEQSERLEQLRFLEAGVEIFTVETSYHPVAVDVAADLERVRRLCGC
jgi:3-deoxy-manno-octulosonate cytidylyltransferase (CMP-KDO synthetase)